MSTQAGFARSSQVATPQMDLGIRRARRTSEMTSVYSRERSVNVHSFNPSSVGLQQDERLRMDGAKFLKLLPEGHFAAAFFDPQYRGILDKMSYGNEGQSRSQARCELPQMAEDTIAEFVRLIGRALIPTGHLFLWVDKYHLCTGVSPWLQQTDLEVVDLVTWDKKSFGMGYRTRRTSEHLIVVQKKPRRAKGVWQVHDIPDVWHEKKVKRSHPHAKPIELQERLVEAVTNPGDFVIDPAAGSFSVLEACARVGRRFLGCDING